MTEPETAAPRRAAPIAGWVLSVLLAALLSMSAAAKFTAWEGKAEAFAKLGWAVEPMHTIGVVEVVVTLLFLFPPTSFFGAVLLTGYLGGATATHVRVDDHFFMPVLIGVLVWVALGLRNPRVFAVAFGLKPTTP